MSEGGEGGGLRWAVGRIWGEIRSRLRGEAGGSVIPEVREESGEEKRPDVVDSGGGQRESDPRVDVAEENRVMQLIASMHEPWMHDELGGARWEKEGMHKKIKITPAMVEWLVGAGDENEAFSMKTGEGVKANKDVMANLTDERRRELLDSYDIVSARDAAIAVARHLYFGFGVESVKGLAHWGLQDQESGERLMGQRKADAIEAIGRMLKGTRDEAIFRVAQEFHEVYFGLLQNVQYVQGDMREVMAQGYYSSTDYYHRLWVDVLAEETAEIGFMRKVKEVRAGARKAGKVMLFEEGMKQVREERLALAPRFTWFAPKENDYGQVEPYRLLEDRFFDVFMKRGAVKLMWDAREKVKLTEAKKWLGVAKKYDGRRLEDIRDERDGEAVRKVREAVMRAVEFRGGLRNDQNLDVNTMRLWNDEGRELKYQCKQDGDYVVEMSDWTRQLVVMLREAAAIPRVYKKGMAKAILPLEDGAGATIMFDADRKAPWTDDVPWVKQRFMGEGKMSLEGYDQFSDADREDARQDMRYFVQAEAKRQGITMEQLFEEKKGKAVKWMGEEVKERLWSLARSRGVSLTDGNGRAKSIEAVINEMPLEVIRDRKGKPIKDESGNDVDETLEGLREGMKAKIIEDIAGDAVDSEIWTRVKRYAQSKGKELTNENMDELTDEWAGSLGVKEVRDKKDSRKVIKTRVEVAREMVEKDLVGRSRREWYWEVELSPLKKAESEGTAYRRARWNKYGFDILQAPTWLEARRKGGSNTFSAFIENQVRKGQAARSTGMYLLRMLMQTSLKVFKVGEGDEVVWNEEWGFAENFVRRQPGKMEALLNPDLIFPREAKNQYEESAYGFLEAEEGGYRYERLLEANYEAGVVPYAAQRAEEVSLHTASVPEMVLRVNEFIKRRWLLTKSIEHPLLAKILQRGKDGMNELIRLEKLSRVGGVVEWERLKQCGMTIMGWDQIRDTKPWQKAIFWRMHLDRDMFYNLTQDFGALTKADEEAPFKGWTRDDLGDFLFRLIVDELDDEGVRVLAKWQANYDAKRNGRERGITEGFSDEDLKYWRKNKNKLMLEAIDRVQRAEAKTLRDDVVRSLARNTGVNLTEVQRKVLDPRLESETAPGVLGEKIKYEVWLNNLLGRVVEAGKGGKILVDGEMLKGEDLKILDPAVEKIEGLSYRQRLERRNELLEMLVNPERTKTAVGWTGRQAVLRDGLWVGFRRGEVGNVVKVGQYGEMRELDAVELGILNVAERERWIVGLAGIDGIVLGQAARTRRYADLAANNFEGIREILRGTRIRLGLLNRIEAGQPQYDFYSWFRLMFESPRGGAAMYHKWMPFIGLENPSDVMAVMDWSVKNKFKLYGVKLVGDAATEMKRLVEKGVVEKHAVRVNENDDSVVFYPMHGFGALNFMETRLEHWTGVGRGRRGKYLEIDADKKAKAERYLGIAKQLLAKQGVMEPEDVVIPNRPGMLGTFVAQMGDYWDSDEGEFIPTFENRLIADASEENGHWGSVTMHLALGDMSYDEEWLRSKRWDSPDTLAAVYDRLSYVISELVKIDERRIKLRFERERADEVVLRIPTPYELGAGLGERGRPTILAVLVKGMNVEAEIRGRTFNFGLRGLGEKLEDMGYRVGGVFLSYFEGLELGGYDHEEIEAARHLVSATEGEAKEWRAIAWDEGLRKEGEEGYGLGQAARLPIEVLSELPYVGQGPLGRFWKFVEKFAYGSSVRTALLTTMPAIGTVTGLSGAILGFNLALSGGLYWATGGAIAGGAVLGFGGWAVGIIPGVLGFHMVRILTGKYKDYYSSGWPLPMNGWVKNLPLLGRVRFLGHPVAGRAEVHTSAIDTSKLSEGTLQGSGGRIF